MSARTLEDVLRGHSTVATGLGEWCCKCSPQEWRPTAHRAAHVAAEVRAWITERLTDEELRESVVRSIYGDGLDGAHDLAAAALTTIAEHLTNDQEASRG